MPVAPITEKFVNALNAKFEGMDKVFTATAGRRYDKVIIQFLKDQRSVHAFVERKTGLLYKAANWSAAAADARHDLSTDESFEKTIAAAEWNGSYLYK